MQGSSGLSENLKKSSVRDVLFFHGLVFRIFFENVVQTRIIFCWTHFGFLFLKMKNKNFCSGELM